jgi:hypothetical protein
MKTFFTFIILFSSITIFAQAPNCLWARNMAGNSVDQAEEAALDAAGNAYVTGWFQGDSLSFDTITIHNAGSFTRDFFIVKYDASGNVLWAKSAGGADDDLGMGISACPDSNIIVTGYFRSPLMTLGSFTLVNSDTNGYSNDIFIVKYDPAGNVLWAKREGGTSNDMANAVATDSTGNAVITGYYLSPHIIAGTDTLVNPDSALNEANVFLIKYDPSGNVLWARSEGGSGSEYAVDVSCGKGDSIVITGYFNSSFRIGSDSLMNTDTSINRHTDLFIAKYDSPGNPVWATCAGGSGANDETNSVSIDPSGNIIICGHYGSAAMFDTTAITSAGLFDVFVGKYDGTGKLLWVKSTGGTYHDYAWDAFADANGDILITGFFGSPFINFDAITLSNASPGGSGDLWLTKLGASGNALWAMRAGTAADEGATSVISDAAGAIFLTGGYSGANITIQGIQLTNSTAPGYQDSFLAKFEGNDTATGVVQQEDHYQLSIYPNPGNGIFIVSSELTVPSQLIITNVLGETIYTLGMKSSGAPVRKEIDLHAQPGGVYFVRLIPGSGAQRPLTQKIIIR